MTKITIEIGCEPGSETCGGCTQCGLGINCGHVLYQCGWFGVVLETRDSEDLRCTPLVLRCGECRAAEVAP